MHPVYPTGDGGMRVKASIIALALAAFPASAFCGQIQSSEDIVKFFAGETGLGVSRGICIGTADECRDKSEAPQPKGLDMLVNFNLDSAELTADAKAKLEEFAKALKDERLRNLHFRVEGYTDASGSEPYNEKLSGRRAESVTQFLTSNGIDAARISAVGLGESHPRSANPYDPINRRVEMRLNSGK
jgi:outer membrane protein OmpA-like peptidoglycan-associated protein